MIPRQESSVPVFTQGGFGKCLPVAPLSLKHTPGNNSFAFRSEVLLPTRPHLGLSAVSTATAAMLPLKISFSIGAVVRKGWPAFLSESLVFRLLRPLPPNLNPIGTSIFAAATLSRPLETNYCFARCCFALLTYFLLCQFFRTLLLRNVIRYGLWLTTA